jgi:flagellar hook assembly protein FlgD
VRTYFWGTADKTPVLHDVTVCWNPYPDAPTLIAPQNNTWINDNTPLFDWNFNDPHPGAAQEGFHLIIDDSPDFSGAYFDSGLQESTSSQWQFPDGTKYTTIPDGTWYWKCCTKNNYDFWGATSTHSMFHLDTTPPPIPVMVPEPELTPGFQNLVSWNSVTDDGIGGVKYYVQCSSDSSFISEVDNSGWIDGNLYEFGRIVPLKDGVTYYYRVKAKDGLGNESKYSLPVWSRQDKPLITDCYASPDPFSPNADGTEDETKIYYTLSRECTVTISIYDSKGNLKKTLVNAESRSEGKKSEIWDGRDEDENIVPNGTYTYKITAVDGMGNRGERQGTVTVENLVSVVSTIPKDNGYFVIGEDKDIKITFNRHMSSTTMTLENIIIRDEDGLRMYKADVVYVSSVTIITPSKLEYCTRYTVEVSKGVTDFLGIPLTEATSFSFTTLIPGRETREVIVEHKGGIVKIDNPSGTFPGGSKGWYINLVKTDIRSLSNYVEGTGRILKCYGVDASDNPKDIDWLDSPVTISIPYPSDTRDKKNLKIYFYNRDTGRWELVKGSGDSNPDDGDYYVTGEVRITNTEYCVRAFAMGGLIEEYCNYPNPFKAGKQETTIIYDLEEDAKVTISIYDLLGQLVKRIEIPKGTLPEGKQGTNKVSWNGKNERGRVVANGGYYCVVEADTETGKHMKKTRKIMVIK